MGNIREFSFIIHKFESQMNIVKYNVTRRFSRNIELKIRYQQICNKHAQAHSSSTIVFQIWNKRMTSDNNHNTYVFVISKGFWFETVPRIKTSSQ